MKKTKKKHFFNFNGLVIPVKIVGKSDACYSVEVVEEVKGYKVGDQLTIAKHELQTFDLSKISIMHDKEYQSTSEWFIENIPSINAYVFCETCCDCDKPARIAVITPSCTSFEFCKDCYAKLKKHYASQSKNNYLTA